jgi:hypothetical protein
VLDSSRPPPIRPCAATRASGQCAATRASGQCAHGLCALPLPGGVARPRDRDAAAAAAAETLRRERHQVALVHARQPLLHLQDEVVRNEVEVHEVNRVAPGLQHGILCVRRARVRVRACVRVRVRVCVRVCVRVQPWRPFPILRSPSSRARVRTQTGRVENAPLRAALARRKSFRPA